MRRKLSLMVLVTLLCAGAALATVTKTIKPSGGDFTDFQSAWNSIPSTLSEDYVFEAYTGTYTTSSNFTGKNTGSYTITFKAASGQTPHIYLYSYSFGIQASSQNNVKLIGLTISAGYPPIYLNSYCDNWRIENCKLNGGAGYGYTVYYGPYCDYDSMIGCQVNGYFSYSGTSSYGVYISGTSSPMNSYCYFANNYVYNWNSYGFYFQYHDYTKLYFNTVYGNGSYAFYDYRPSGNSNADYQNNLFVGGSYAYFLYGYYPTTQDYNCYRLTSGGSYTMYVQWPYNTHNQTLATYKVNSGKEANGFDTDPMLVGPTDYHIRSTSSCKDKGTAITGISKDLDGDTRPQGTYPDVGCDEFVPGSPLSGTKTIKQDGTGDFTSFTSAISAMSIYGVGGALTFNVYAGTYNEALNITNPLNAQYRVTFQALESDGIDNVVLNAGGASYAIQLTDCQKLRFRNFKISNFGSYGIYLGYSSNGTDTCLFEGNTISGYNGIYFAQGADYDSVVGNYIQATSSYGVYFTSGSPYKYYNVFANNAITGWNSYGIYSYYTYYTSLYYNTIYSLSGSYAFRSYYDYNLTQQDNIYYSPSYPYYNGTSTLPDVSNYNCFKVHNGTPPYSSLIYFGGSRSLSSWQSSYSRDQQSIEVDPQVAGPTNPHIKNASGCKDAGTAITGITKDIDLDTRPQGSVVDIGCDEFIPGSPLSGTKTIKQDGTGDYTSFTAALSALQIYGQSGNLTFEVYAGTYAEGRLNLQGLGNGTYWVTFKAAQVADAYQNVVYDAAGQSYAVYLYDNARIAFRGIKFQNFTSWGFYLDRSSTACDYITIDGCRISGPNGIFLREDCNYDSIYGNTILATSSYGIQNNSTTPYVTYLYLANNMIYALSYSVMLQYHQYSQVYYNTMYCPNSVGFYNYYGYGATGLNIDLKNNIMVGSGTAYYHYYGDLYPGSNFDYNCYWAMSGSNPIYHPYYGNMPLSTWQSWNGTREQHSIQANPGVLSTSDLHITRTSPCFEKGTPISGITKDLDGDTRDLVKPDIGADEVFTDIAVSQILQPTGDYPVGSVVTPMVEVKNLGGVTATFNLFFRGFKGGSQVYSATYPNKVLAGGKTDTVSLTPDWTLSASGLDYTTFAWHSLMPDDNATNDQASGAFRVGSYDVSCEEIQAPTGDIVQGTSVFPKVKLHNYGTFDATFDVTFQIDDGTDGQGGDAEVAGSRPLVKDALVYNESENVTVAAGADLIHEFATSYDCPTVGAFTTHTEHNLAGDQNPLNDEANGAFDVIPPPHHDVGTTVISVPTGTVIENTPVYPQVTVRNYGEATETFPVRVIITDATDAEVYNETETVTALGVTEIRVVDFTTVWTATPTGLYAVRCTTELGIDEYHPNDKQTGTFRVRAPVVAGWEEMIKHVPGATAVKDGGWLTVADDGADRYVYVAKGNKTPDFYRYDPIADSFEALAPINADEGGRTKLPKKGCAGVSDGDAFIYMTKGNNTTGFWKYDISGDSWSRLPDVPLGPDGKKVKGGTDLAYVQGVTDEESSYVYLMKGYRTEFYRFNVDAGRWDTLDNLPYGIAPKYNAGSFLVYDDAGVIYANQSKYTDALKTHHYMFKYDVATQAWVPEPGAKGMPVLGMDGGKMKSKKSKDGGSGAWYDGRLYALKGGNTVQFYQYEPLPGDTWTELDTMKSFGSTGKKKKVKAGGDLAHFGDGTFFALKGNKTSEFWRYVAGVGLAAPRPVRSGVMAGGTGVSRFELAVTPNPMVNGRASLRFSLPQAGPVVVSVFDVAGRTVQTQSLLCGKTGSTSLDLRKLANGVYLVRLDADGFSSSQKLVVQQ